MNRHADALSDFTECVQAALNRNGHKPDLDTMSVDTLLFKIREEAQELEDEVKYQYNRDFHGEGFDPKPVEHEAADLAVCALAAFILARQRGREADGISSA